jgi:hypothetical protein
MVLCAAQSAERKIRARGLCVLSQNGCVLEQMKGAIHG